MNIIELSLNCHLKKNSSQMCSNPFTQSITPMITHMSAQVLRVSFHPARPPATHYTRLAIRRMEASPRKLAPPVPKEAKAKMTMFMTSEARASLCITASFGATAFLVAAPRCPGLRDHHHHQSQIKSGRMS